MIKEGKTTQEEHDCWFIETENIELEEEEEDEE